MKIGVKIRGWYKKNKRDLPWRQTNDPYKIWLSEVILQQTRVNQGLQYYLDFIKDFPDVLSLARASEDKVLKRWQGLGYYSRARNLHRAARDVVEQMDGRIPGSYDGLLKLKGVGKYTASAIASICFGEARAVVDGNVSRVIARLFGIEEPINNSTGSKVIESLANELLDHNDPGTHNQAMMEFGALQCVPVSPDCERCPLSDHCEARKTDRVTHLPVKIPKRKPVDQWMYFFIFICGEEIIITKRGTEGIWKSLYQFPMVESNAPFTAKSKAPYTDKANSASFEKEIIEPMLVQLLQGTGLTADGGSLRPDRVTIRKISDPVRHQLTHRTIHARFIHVHPASWPQQLPAGWIKISLDRLNDFPVPRLINRYMEVVKI